MTEREQELEQLLVETMVHVHHFVVHCGTKLEDRALTTLGLEPPADIYGYKLIWNQELRKRASEV